MHLHARWAIQALIDCASKQGIPLEFHDYNTFFRRINSECSPALTTYIAWECTPNRRKICAHVEKNWAKRTSDLLSKSDSNVFVGMMHFEKVSTVNKQGNEVVRLKPQRSEMNIASIITFISNLMPNIIHHRNQLKHYRNTISDITDMFNTVSIDIDFCENLSVPVKQEPQSLHWCHQQVTVHSGILKVQAEKSYHPYLSDDTTQDQVFVNVAIREILKEVDEEMFRDGTVLIQSNNCSSQYKSAEHFAHLQQLSNEYNSIIIRVWSIAGHGKGEVDHVGGVAKITIKREIGNGEFFYDAGEMVERLNEKFYENKSPCYFFKEIHRKKLEQERSNSKLKSYKTIDGSTLFQVIVFHPHSSTVKAASRLCICSQCKESYGSCDLFSEHELVVRQLNNVSLRSGSVEVNPEDSVARKGKANEYLLPGSVGAIAAGDTSSDTVWFINVTKQSEATDVVTDDYGFTVQPGQQFIEGHFIELINTSSKGRFYISASKTAFFFKESVVYPFVQMSNVKGKRFMNNNDYAEILYFVEQTGMASLL
eukprot:gene20851-22896_t